MNWFEKINRSDKIQAIGLMSGTSADGLDLARITIRTGRIKTDFVLEDFVSVAYSPEIKEKILKIAAPDGGNIEDVCKLNFFLGHFYSNCILEYLQKNQIKSEEIDFIGTHGQTVCHLPEKITENGITFASTLQIADPSIIANRTGILTVGDFRNADVALGGQGAPLIPIFDYSYFLHPEKNRILLNIGGIANITYLPQNCTFEEVIAFDTGPGNVLIDIFSQQYYGVPYDIDGLIAESGEPDPDFLSYLLEDDYFTQTPPKSTGREKYAGPFYERTKRFMQKKNIHFNNVVSSLTELTAISIYQASQRFLNPNIKIHELIVSGGGVENPSLMKRLAHYFTKTPIFKSDEFGLKSEAKEAICFAMLAYQTLLGKATSMPSVTGAKAPTILGKICLPPPNPATSFVLYE